MHNPDFPKYEISPMSVTSRHGKGAVTLIFQTRTALTVTSIFRVRPQRRTHEGIGDERN